MWLTQDGEPIHFSLIAILRTNWKGDQKHDLQDLEPFGLFSLGSL